MIYSTFIQNFFSALMFKGDFLRHNGNSLSKFSTSDYFTYKQNNLLNEFCENKISWSNIMCDNHKVYIQSPNYFRRVFQLSPKLTDLLPLRFRKAGKMWCGGARETHWATSHNEVTPSKTKEFLKPPCFLDICGS